MADLGKNPAREGHERLKSVTTVWGTEYQPEQVRVLNL